jgi:hypothetical protein
VDLDSEAAKHAFAERCGGQLPVAPTVRTRKGLHLYFAHLRNGIFVPTRAGVLPGLDVRGDGGYVAAPPSLHESGHVYVMERDTVTLPPMPEWLLAVASAPPRQAGGAIEAAGGIVGTWRIPEGRRNATLFRYACGLRARGMDESTILWMLEVENEDRCDPILDQEELARIAVSATRYRKGS